MVQPLVRHDGLLAGNASKSSPKTLRPPGLSGLLAVGQHPLGAINPLAEATLKRIVLLAFLDMASDSHANDLRDWADHRQLRPCSIPLLGRQTDELSLS